MLGLLIRPAHATSDDSAFRVYPAPAGEPVSVRYQVSLGDAATPCPVYLATVLSIPAEQRQPLHLELATPDQLGQTGFTSFDLRRTVKVTVTYYAPIDFVKLLPTASGVVPAIAGSTVSFWITKPGQWVLDVNGDWVHSLQIFANPWEEDAPDPKDPNVLYYGPGIHKLTTVHVSSGQTVYVAGGAVIYGSCDPGEGGAIFELRGDHITLRGRGIIDGSLCPSHTRVLAELAGHDITMEGVTLRDPSGWTMPIQGSDGVNIKNIKLFGYRPNSDGIDINNSQNVSVSDSFLRTCDDLVVLKASNLGKGDTQNVTVSHCVLWNEFAHALSLGAELRKDVTNVVFQDCDIVHDKGREWLLRVYQCDAGHVGNITFKDIRIEECRRLISVWIGSAIWSRDPERGHVDNVTFQNIVSPAPERASSPVELKGFDADHAIHGVTLDGVVVAGQPLRMADVKQNEFVDGVTVTP